MRSIAIALLLGLLLPATGCLSLTDPLGNQDALETAQRRYTQLMRWGEIERASGFVAPDQREEFLGYVPLFAKLRLSEYESGEIVWGKGTATVSVTYRGFALDFGVEKTVTEQQEWTREGYQSWVVRPQLGGFSEAFARSAR
jgi:hypothetical protein